MGKLKKSRFVSFVLLFFVLFTSLCQGMTLGHTPITVENLVYKYSNDPYGLFQYANENLMYSRVADQPQRASKTLSRGYGDCDDFAVLYKTVLDRGMYKSEALVITYPGTRTAHVVLAVKYKGEIVLFSDNDKYIETGCNTLSAVEKKHFRGASKVKILNINKYCHA